MNTARNLRVNLSVPVNSSCDYEGGRLFRELKGIPTKSSTQEKVLS